MPKYRLHMDDGEYEIDSNVPADSLPVELRQHLSPISTTPSNTFNQLASMPLQAILSTISTPARMAFSIANPSSPLGRNPELTGGLAGGLIGSLGGLPGEMLGAGIGTGLGRAIEETRTPRFQDTGQLTPGAPVRIAGSAALNALIPLGLHAGGAFLKTGGKLIAASRMGKRLASAADQAQFIQRVRGFLKGIPRRAGGRFKPAFDQVVTDSPNAVGDFSTSLGELREEYLKNPYFRTAFDQEVQNLPEEGQTVVRQALNPMKELPAEANFTESEAMDIGNKLSLKDSQPLKRVLQRMSRRGFTKDASELTALENDALHLYHRVRADQFGAFPAFQPVASRYHQELDGYRLLRNATQHFSPEGLPRALATDFTGESELGLSQFGKAPEVKAASEQAFQDDPELARDVSAFRDAVQLNTLGKRVLTRGATFALTAPFFYYPYSLARRAATKATTPQKPKKPSFP